MSPAVSNKDDTLFHLVRWGSPAGVADYTRGAKK